MNESKYLGTLVGLAVGDCVGAPVEFMEPGTFEPVVDMLPGGVHKLKVGQWTDDTSLALCLAESLLDDGFSLTSQADKYVRWWKDGYLSSTGECFDIGNATALALKAYVDYGVFANTLHHRMAGNGSIMRLAPVPMAYPLDVNGGMSSISSLTTHPLPVCADACRLLGMMISSALRGLSKKEILEQSDCQNIMQEVWHPEVWAMFRGSYMRKDPPYITNGGYVVSTLESALWAFNKTDTFEDGLLLCVNLGLDSDTVGAVYGQLAGAFYGIENIPSKWVDKIYMIDYIEELAESLLELGKENSGKTGYGGK